jgi:hypothetical protein
MVVNTALMVSIRVKSQQKRIKENDNFGRVSK